MAGAALGQGEMERAVRLFGAAQSLRQVMGTPLPLVERSVHEQRVVAARAELSEEVFGAAWAEGETMALEAAVAEALRCQGPGQ
jgi:hypothetical protein